MPRVLTIDPDDFFGSTTNAITGEFGEAHRATWLALVELDAQREDRAARRVGVEASILAVRVLGRSAGSRPGAARRVLGLMKELHGATVVVPGYDLNSNCPAEGTTFTCLFENVDYRWPSFEAANDPESDPEWLGCAVNRDLLDPAAPH